MEVKVNLHWGSKKTPMKKMTFVMRLKWWERLTYAKICIVCRDWENKGQKEMKVKRPEIKRHICLRNWQKDGMPGNKLKKKKTQVKEWQDMKLDWSFGQDHVGPY